MKRTTLFVALLCSGLFNNSIFAQSAPAAADDHKLFFVARGFSLLTDYCANPSQDVYTYADAQGQWTLKQQTLVYSVNQWNYGTLMYRLRLNVAEFGKNGSLSLSFIPGLGIGQAHMSTQGGANTDGGFDGNLNLPLLLEYNSGNVSTFSADKDKGFVIGAGMEYFISPLFPININVTDVNGNTQEVGLATTFLEPIVEVGYRYWGKQNSAQEISLKGGFGSNGAFSVRLCLMKYIGY